MISTLFKLTALPSLILAAALFAGCRANGTKKSDTSTGTAPEKDPGEMLAVGQMAPDFVLQDETGTIRKLSDFKGKQPLVLVFYPGDNTPGCTAQLCAIRDNWDGFKDSSVQVFGVNKAGAQSHQSFISRNNYPFPLLVDSEGAMTRAYGCNGLAGIIKRTVYGIDKDGRIVFAERGAPAPVKILAAVK